PALGTRCAEQRPRISDDPRVQVLDGQGAPPAPAGRAGHPDAGTCCHPEEQRMLKEFKEFTARGNVVDLAVGVIIGAAFGAITTSLVNDVIMPAVGLLLGGVDFSSMFVVLSNPGNVPVPPTPELAQQAGIVTLNYGIFINAVINFLII